MPHDRGITFLVGDFDGKGIVFVCRIRDQQGLAGIEAHKCPGPVAGADDGELRQRAKRKFDPA